MTNAPVCSSIPTSRTSYYALVARTNPTAVARGTCALFFQRTHDTHVHQQVLKDPQRGGLVGERRLLQAIICVTVHNQNDAGAGAEPQQGHVESEQAPSETQYCTRTTKTITNATVAASTTARTNLTSVVKDS
jgi:hypothetical protein